MNADETSVRALLVSLGLGLTLGGCSTPTATPSDGGIVCGNAACCAPECNPFYDAGFDAGADAGSDASADAGVDAAPADASDHDVFVCGNAACCLPSCNPNFDAGEPDADAGEAADASDQ